jgi:hypothetical protein
VTEESSQVVEEPDSEKDDAEIPDDEILYRRLSYEGGAWVHANPATGQRRPASAGFQPDQDGVSVFRRNVLFALDPSLGPADVANRTGDVVVGFLVRDVRALKLGVRNDAWPKDIPDPENPRNAAHALIVGWRGLGKSARIKRQKQLAMAPSMEFVNG